MISCNIAIASNEKNIRLTPSPVAGSRFRSLLDRLTGLPQEAAIQKELS